MGVPRRTIVTHVVVPAAMPSLLVAIRLGVARAWTAVVAAELIGAPSGLGYADRVVSRAADDAAGDGVHRDDRRAGLPRATASVRALARWLTPWATDARSAHERWRGLACAARLCCCRSRLLVVWQAWGTATGNPRTPVPTHVAAAAVELIALAAICRSRVLQSVGRVFGGFAVAAALAIPLGLAMGSFRSVERNVDPLVESFRPIAAIAILPLAILWLGTGTSERGRHRRVRGVLSDRHQYGRRA